MAVDRAAVRSLDVGMAQDRCRARAGKARRRLLSGGAGSGPRRVEGGAGQLGVEVLGDLGDLVACDPVQEAVRVVVRLALLGRGATLGLDNDIITVGED